MVTWPRPRDCVAWLVSITASNLSPFSPTGWYTLEGSAITCFRGDYSLRMTWTHVCAKINVLIPTDSSSRKRWIPAIIAEMAKGAQWGVGAIAGDTNTSQHPVPHEKQHGQSSLFQ